MTLRKLSEVNTLTPSSFIQKLTKVNSYNSRNPQILIVVYSDIIQTPIYMLTKIELLMV